MVFWHFRGLANRGDSPSPAGEFLEITNNLLKACLSYANQPIQNPCHQPLPLSNSPTLKAIIAPALITLGPSTKQLGITAVAQSPQKWIKLSNPKLAKAC